MLKRIPWRLLLLAALIGGAFLNQWYVIDNPSLERKVVGCWAISGGNERLAGAAVLQVFADGTFTEASAYKEVSGKRTSSGTARSSGSWRIQRDELTLSYLESAGNHSDELSKFLRERRGSLKLTIIEAERDRFVGRTRLPGYYVYERLPPSSSSCSRAI